MIDLWLYIMASANTIPVSDTDHLDEDKPLRGQNFVCLSFLSPEDTLKDKEVFTFSKFLGSFSKQVDDMFTGLKEKYPEDVGSLDTIRENHAHIFSADELQDQYRFYKEVHHDLLDKEFAESNEFRTNIRGIKVRGVFDTLKEAQVRADVLKRMGDKFDIFVGQVGCWCPWSPYPVDLEDQQYAETQLNTLMSKYKDNMQQRDELYASRKDLKIKAARTAFETASKAITSTITEVGTDPVPQPASATTTTDAQQMAVPVESQGSTV